MELGKIFCKDYSKRLEKLSSLIEGWNGRNYTNLEYITFYEEYVNTLSRMLSNKEEAKNRFDYIYSKIHLMVPHNIKDQEMINKVVKKINVLCPNFQCTKIKDANGNII